MMRRPPYVLLLLNLLPLLHLSALCHEGRCYWTESCESKWLGGCGEGGILADRSDNCNGLCSHPPCLPFHTHFQCCQPQSPILTHNCASCSNKLDFGDNYICCTDCSDPSLVDQTTKLGYCKTGARLAMQLKPQEVFKWVAGPWMKCSSPCDGGVRYRDVGCYGSLKDSSIKHYPVDDTRCLEHQMPTKQESCNLHSCGELSTGDSHNVKPRRMSGWFVALLVLLGLVAVVGLSFAGYSYYKRRTSAPSGFVYIMLEGYS